MMPTQRLLREGRLRPRERELPRIRSMLKSAEMNARIATGMPITGETSTLIFREVYESIRQLGDARWWLAGYEPRDHEASIEALQDADVKEKVLLHRLSRFKRIRHDINYRGFLANEAQAREIAEFWGLCGKEILGQLQKEVK